MVVELVFMDEVPAPLTRKKRADYVNARTLATAAAYRAQPGRWALWPTKVTAYTLRKTLAKLSDAAHWEVVPRRVDDLYRAYVRWVPEVAVVGIGSSSPTPATMSASDSDEIEVVVTSTIEDAPPLAEAGIEDGPSRIEPTASEIEPPPPSAPRAPFRVRPERPVSLVPERPKPLPKVPERVDGKVRCPHCKETVTPTLGQTAPEALVGHGNNRPFCRKAIDELASA